MTACVPAPHQTGRAVFPHPAFRVSVNVRIVLRQFGRYSVESIIAYELRVRPAFIFPRGIPVLAPEPLPQPMVDEEVHLPGASVLVGGGKVVAPTTGRLIDFADDFVSRPPGCPSRG